MYHYGGNNPVRYIDPDGRILETAWDIASLVTGVASLVADVRAGNVKAAVIDSLGIVADGVAVALPCIPGGAGAAIKAARIAGAAANIVGGALSVQDGLEKGDYLEAGAGALQAVSGIGQLSKALSAGTKAKIVSKKVNGVDVIQDNSIINLDLVDSRGRTNAERMKKGLAPIGPDGKSVNLHHVDQTMNGPVQELTATNHQKNYSSLHSNTGQTPSQINRKEFETWRNQYWKQRVEDF